MTAEESFVAAVIREAVELITTWCTPPGPLPPGTRRCGRCGVRRSTSNAYRYCNRCHQVADTLRAYLWMFHPDDFADEFILPFREICQITGLSESQVQRSTIECCDPLLMDELHRAANGYIRLRSWLAQQSVADSRMGALLSVAIQHPTCGEGYLTYCAKQAVGGMVSVREVRKARERLRTEGFIP
jgi:hypothetical protein